MSPTRAPPGHHRSASGLGVVCLIAAAVTGCSTGPAVQSDAGQSEYLRAWSAIYTSQEKPLSETTYHRSLELLEAPAFRTLSGSMQHLLLVRISQFALQQKDFARAHELAIRASSMADAGIEDWLIRTEAAYFANDRLDACRSLTHLLRQWPDRLSRISDQFLRALAGPTPASEAERKVRFELLEALYETRWTDQYGVTPASLWGALAMQLAERGELRRALEVAVQVDSPRIMVLLRADKRFDALVRQAPPRFDIAAAGEREIRDWGDAVQRFPRKLDAVVQLTNALLDVGQYDAAYQLTHEILSAIDNNNVARSFDDDPTALNWILDYDARALEGHQQWQEAEWDLRGAADRMEHGQRNVSNVINLAAFEERLGRGDEALRVLSELPGDAAQMSPYGRMQWYDVRLAAAVQKGDAALVIESLAYMAAHQADALSTYQFALLRVNQPAAAADLLIRRLADPATRAEALADIQRYHDPPTRPPQQILRDRLRELVRRADVKVAIERVGRVLDVPLPSPLE